MVMKNIARLLLGLGSGCPLVAVATENLPHPSFAEWTRLPADGQFIITPQYSYNYWKKYWKNHASVDIQRVSQDGFDHNTGGVRFDYRLARRWALDATVGYTSGATRFFDPNRTPRTSLGLADSQLGLRYQLATEGKPWWQPNLTARVGGILQGTYAADFPFAPGHGGSGIETAFGFTKRLSDCGFGLYGDCGWRLRNHDVPQTVFGSFGLAQTIRLSGWARGLTMNFGYAHSQDLSGPDVTGTLIDVNYSHRVKEVSRSIEGGVTLTDRDGWVYQYRMEMSMDGRNTPQRTLYGLALSVPFASR